MVCNFGKENIAHLNTALSLNMHHICSIVKPTYFLGIECRSTVQCIFDDNRDNVLSHPSIERHVRSNLAVQQLVFLCRNKHNYIFNMKKCAVSLFCVAVV